MEFQKRYEFNPKTDLLGKGGFSRVYKATDTLLDRTVALKFFTADASTKYQILSEIKKVIRFEHQNLCKYYDVALLSSENMLGEAESIEVGIMEYLDSGDFRTFVSIHPEHIDKLLIDILKGLAYLHKRGIVHRDLKPQNILIKMEDDEPIAKITDFGISKVLKADDKNSTTLMGTIEYMAPEQFNPKRYGVGGRITTNLDLWSFGLLVYEMMTHQKLFGSRSTGVSAEQVMSNILGDLPALQSSSLTGKYKEIVDRCLVKDASQRVQNATELIAILEGTRFSQMRGGFDAAPSSLPSDNGYISNKTPVEDGNVSISSGNPSPGFNTNQQDVEPESENIPAADDNASLTDIQIRNLEEQTVRTEVGDDTNPETDSADTTAIVPDSHDISTSTDTTVPKHPELIPSSDLSSIVPQYVDSHLAEIIQSSELQGNADGTKALQIEQSIIKDSEVGEFDKDSDRDKIGDDTVIIGANEILPDANETQVLHPDDLATKDISDVTTNAQLHDPKEQLEVVPQGSEKDEEETKIVQLKPTVIDEDTQLLDLPGAGDEETKIIAAKPLADEDTQLIRPGPSGKDEETRVYAYKQLPKKPDDKQIIHGAAVKSTDPGEVSKPQNVVYKVDDALIQSLKDEMVTSEDTQVLQNKDQLETGEETGGLEREKDLKTDEGAGVDNKDTTYRNEEEGETQTYSTTKWKNTLRRRKQDSQILTKRSFVGENVKGQNAKPKVIEWQASVRVQNKDKGSNRNTKKIVILVGLAAAMIITLWVILMPGNDKDIPDSSKPVSGSQAASVLPQPSSNESTTPSAVLIENPEPAVRPSEKEGKKVSVDPATTKTASAAAPATKSQLETVFTASEDCTLEIEGLAPIALKKNQKVAVPMDSGRHNITAVSKNGLPDSKMVVSILRNNQSFTVRFNQPVSSEPTTSVVEPLPSAAGSPAAALPSVAPVDKSVVEDKISVPVDKTPVESPTAITLAPINLIADEISSNMVFMKGGKFEKIDERSAKNNNSGSLATVSPYMLGKFEVTQRQWQQVMGYNNSVNKGCPECPVENVSWEEVNKFLNMLNQNGKAKFRLPTNLEWSFAAQMDDHEFIDGIKDYQNKVAWLSSNSNRRTHPVGQKMSHKSGVYDLLGNVGEWCADWYGPASGSQKVVKGGNFADVEKRATDGLSLSSKKKTVGFRLVKY
jgi:serine/threonine protein kinase/formylglycine-generating enzyme required for sulfatase activity